MDIESVLPFLLAFVSLGSFVLGRKVRERIHVLLPYKDPVTMLFVIGALLPVIMSLLGYNFPISPLNTWYLAFTVAFLICYSASYCMGEFDLCYIAIHTIISEEFPSGALQVKPCVYYYGYDDGKLYCQEQSFKEILKSTFLHIRSPLKLDIGRIQRTRPIFVQKVLFPLVSVDAVDVVEEVISESVVVKGKIFKFKVRSYAYTPAPSCIDSSANWLVSAYNQDSLTKELTRKEAQLLESKITAQSQFYAKSADLLVDLIVDRTPGADVYQEITEKLAPVEDEIETRELRMPSGRGQPEVKHKSKLKSAPPKKSERAKNPPKARQVEQEEMDEYGEDE